jgi:FkbM family methyltransferase
MEHLELLMAYTLAPDDNVLDIGAYVGMVLERAVRRAPRGRHIAYEPLPELAAELASHYPQVEVRNAAVAASPGTATFFRNAPAPAQSSLNRLDVDPGHLEPLEVRLEALDHDLPSGWAPALIKIDVEGAEAEVLEGARALLAQHQPFVVLEHGLAAAHFGSDPGDVHRLLSEAGLLVYDIDGNGPYDAKGFDDRVRPGDIWTFVARPPHIVSRRSLDE